MCFKDELVLVKDLLLKRLNYFLKGVPQETRVVTIEGNTEYMRPLSGSARMYPETDLDSINFTDDLISEVKKNLPLSLKEREILYVSKFKINPQLADKMKLNNFAPIFEEIVKKTNINATTLSVFLLEDLIKASRDSLVDLDDVSDKLLLNFFSFKNILDVVPKSKLLDTFIEYLKNPFLLDQIILKNKKVDVDDSVLRKIIVEIILENKNVIEKQKERSIGLIMGRTMAKTDNKYDGKLISEIAKQEIKLFLEKNKSF